MRAQVGVASGGLRRKGCWRFFFNGTLSNRTLLLHRKLYKFNKRHLRLHRNQLRPSQLTDRRVPISNILLIPRLLHACKCTSRPRQARRSNTSRPYRRIYLFTSPNFQEQLHTSTTLILVTKRQRYTSTGITRPTTFRCHGQQTTNGFTRLQAIYGDRYFISNSVRHRIKDCTNRSISKRKLRNTIPNLCNRYNSYRSLTRQCFRPQKGKEKAPFRLQKIPHSTKRTICLSLLPKRRIPYKR